MTSPTDFPFRLTTLREAKSLTIPELARISGIPAQTIHRLERGERKPGWAILCKLANALECPLDDFREVRSE